MSKSEMHSVKVRLIILKKMTDTLLPEKFSHLSQLKIIRCKVACVKANMLILTKLKNIFF